MDRKRYIGLMSGTSMDGIDAALLGFGEHRCKIEHSIHKPYAGDVLDALRAAVATPSSLGSHGAAELDILLAHEFAEATLRLLEEAAVPHDTVAAVGSHGQTILHQPVGPVRLSVQIGNPATLAVLTGLTVVADFRAADVALGGQGAPLAPAFHEWLFADMPRPFAVVNIGGIANVTILGDGAPTRGFDCGPGNTLLDNWCRRHLRRAFDAGGAWAASGQPRDDVLDRMLADPFFSAAPPKSTGLEYFHDGWIEDMLGPAGAPPEPADVQATLAELTAAGIAGALAGIAGLKHVSVCGGGAHNDDLMARIARRMPACSIATTAAAGISPDWVEAAAFAWLARERLAGRPGNLPSVTGAASAVPLGGVWLPPPGSPQM